MEEEKGKGEGRRREEEEKVRSRRMGKNGRRESRRRRRRRRRIGEGRRRTLLQYMPQHYQNHTELNSFCSRMQNDALKVHQITPTLVLNIKNAISRPRRKVQ